MILRDSNANMHLERDKNRIERSDRCNRWVMWEEEREVLDKCLEIVGVQISLLHGEHGQCRVSVRVMAWVLSYT